MSYCGFSGLRLSLSGTVIDLSLKTHNRDFSKVNQLKRTRSCGSVEDKQTPKSVHNKALKQSMRELHTSEQTRHRILQRKHSSFSPAFAYNSKLNCVLLRTKRRSRHRLPPLRRGTRRGLSVEELSPSTVAISAASRGENVILRTLAKGLQGVVFRFWSATTAGRGVGSFSFLVGSIVRRTVLRRRCRWSVFRPVSDWAPCLLC